MSGVRAIRDGEAEHVYVLMTDAYRMSRNSRAQWYFNNLNRNVQILPKENMDEFKDEMEIISILPSHYQDYICDDITSDSLYSRAYFISANTKITFFARRYRLVYILDLSPSISAVDIQHSRILLEEVFTILDRSLRGVAQPFYVPGSRFLFKPEIYITVIGYTPFNFCDIHQVLAQGIKINAQNIDDFLLYLQTKLNDMIVTVSDLSAKANDERDDNQLDSDVLIGSLFEENENRKPRVSQISTISSDISMVNILRFGLLALQLMPENSNAGIVIVTDGMLSMPNANMLESALTQLRYHTIACSFLQIGSNPHPHSCFGFLPYTDLMKFISTATFGAYLSTCPEIYSTIGGHVNFDFNIYHRAFLAWNFQRGLFGFKDEINHHFRHNEWTIDNPYFYSSGDSNNLCLNFSRETRDQQIVRNKQIENSVSAQLTQVLSCRLREGYTIKNVNYTNDNQIEVKLVLPWRHNVNIEYNISSSLRSVSVSDDSNVDDQPECHYEVIVEGSYNFLHDVTCAIKKPIKSSYRSATIRQFWSTLKCLSESDKLEVQLHNFTKISGCRNVPESLKNGVPLFYMPPNSADPVLSSENIAHSQFAQYWKPLCTFDVNIWQKWMHTHRINIILEHDMPLPKHLHLPNASGGYANIECRQALTSLSVILKESSSFVLLENHSYIKLLYNSPNDLPYSFYMIRVISQPPCLVVYLAFIGGTSGYLRNKIINELKERLKDCTIAKRSVSSLNSQRAKIQEVVEINLKNESGRKSPTPLQRELVPVKCCIILRKPIEKILVRYNKIPLDFSVLFDKRLTQHNANLNGSYNTSVSSNQNMSLNMFQTLTCYLHHQRWIWSTNSHFNSHLNCNSLARILSVITKIRMEEGFNFAQNESGIINMVREFPIKDESELTCIVQYVIFPPHSNILAKKSLSDEEDLDLSEDDCELELITECWVEPQNGLLFDLNKRGPLFHDLKYIDISQVFYPVDMEAISSLLTLEHILDMCDSNDGKSWCQKPVCALNDSLSCAFATCDQTSPDQQLIMQSSLTLECSTPDIISISHCNSQSDRSIKSVKFTFNIIHLLPKCQQALILFSTLFQKINISKVDAKNVQLSDVTNEILLETLILKFEEIHDREIILNQSDVIAFIHQVNGRQDDDERHILSFSNDTNDHTSTGKLKCFCKKINSNSVIITIIPASYRDLKCLLFPKKENSFDFFDNWRAKFDEDLDGSSLTLPVYIYKCSYTSLSDQLVYLSEGKSWEDLYIDNTYKSHDNNHQFAFKEFQQTNDNESEYPLNNSSLKQFCQAVQSIYWNCMLQAIYRSLQFGYFVDKRDILTVVKDVCDTAVYKIDITKFITYLCQHLKEYIIKNNSNEFSGDYTKLNSDNTSIDSTAATESVATIDLLRAIKLCEERKELHSDINEKFLKMLQIYFTPIPCFPEYYFFNWKKQRIDIQANYFECQNENNDNLDKSESQKIINFISVDDINNSIALNNEKNEDKVNDGSTLNNHNIVKSISKNETLDESVSLSISISSKLSSNLLDLASDEFSSLPNNSMTLKSTPTANTLLENITCPLFLNLSCAIKTRSGHQQCFINCLPTCIEDIFSFLDTKISEIDLQDLEITLNLNCLTRFNNNDLLSICKLQKFKKSSSRDMNERDIEDNIDINDINQDVNTLLRNDLNNKLSDVQIHAVEECMEKIHWLLKDEIASTALDSYPINESTLEMVISHIDESPNTEFSFSKQVQLKFVYGSTTSTAGSNYNISLNRFCDSMGQIKLNGYQLKKEGRYYYISYDHDSNVQQNISSNYFLNSLMPSMSANIHYNDGTHLHEICSKNVAQNIFDVSGKNTDLFSDSTMPFISIKDMNKDNSIQRGSEDSFEDEKSAAIKKRITSRKHAKSRSSSVPPSSPIKFEEAVRKPGQSLPEADFEFIKNLKKKSLSGKDDSRYHSATNVSKASSDDINIINSNEENCLPEGESCPSSSTVKAEKSFIQNNIEDPGYEGDSDSNSEGESFNWLALDNKRPLVPKFWLIMQIDVESVLLYFHTRPIERRIDSFIKGTDIFNHVVNLIESICKTVNQMLLLENLHDTRMCDNLLVPTEDNDPWNKSRRTVLNRNHLPHSTEHETDVELMNTKTKFSKTNIVFSRAVFSCDIIWQKHFFLHPKLQSGSLRGISALRTVLNSFSVNNRKNLYVYQESSGAVFYLRLFEIDCNYHNYIYDQKSLDSSRTPSESSLNVVMNKKGNNEEINVKIKTDLSTSDKDKDHDNLSIISHTSSRFHRNNSEKQYQQQCILLNVHGIREVGRDIKEDMVGALQKKLDEAVLDILIIMLSRNPHSKLTPEDVFFIQKSAKEPTATLKFMVDFKYIEYMHAIKVYLRQNLLTVMHNPKYTETSFNYHFKANNLSDAAANDEDTFLYYRQQASGSDSKGIACIILSLVDGQGNTIQHMSCPSLYNTNINELKVLLSDNFDDVTKCYLYEDLSNPGAIALIQFHIWCVGKMDVQQLSKILRMNIKHALWDLILEFKLMKCSLNNYSENLNLLETSVSEPSTPKGRRLGKISNLPNHKALIEKFEASKEISFSAPNIHKNNIEKDISNKNFFKFSPFDATNVELNVEQNVEKETIDNEAEAIENLLCIINSLICPWLEYARQLDVVSVVKQQYDLLLRHSVPHVIKEYILFMQNISSQTSISAYKKINDYHYMPCEDIEQSDSEFENAVDLIILVRHDKLWRASATPSKDNYHLDNLPQSKSERPKFRFMPHICNLKGLSEAEYCAPLSAPNISNLNSNQVETIVESLTCIVPRQKFILLFVEDKTITLYIYNWSNEYITNICKNLSNLISWHNSRSSFMQSVILQKAGLFHNQPFKRKTSLWANKMGHSSNNLQYIKNQKQRFNSFSAAMNENVDFLLKHHNPVAAAQEHSQAKKICPSRGNILSNPLKLFRNYSNLTPIQSTNLATIKDVVSRYGNQIKLCDTYLAKDLHELSKVWHIHGTKIHNPVLEKMIKRVKQMGRLNHYCLTPLLFSPKWRYSLSPVRDHSIHALDVIEEEPKLALQANNHQNRLRHASGGYFRPISDLNPNLSRSRRLSGPAIGVSVPKINPEESWHFSVCTHYIQEYVQYLQTLGFGAIPLRSQRTFNSLMTQNLIPKEDSISCYKSIIKQPFSHRKFNSKGDSEKYYLIKSLLGGLLVFEVGFCEPYVYSYLYSFDAKRFDSWNRSGKSIGTSFSSSFLDELDKIKVTMHLHSFTYDYHLRTVHSYISGRQLIFRQGYHLTSFLDDFIKYYQKAPNYARNYVHLGQMTINNTAVPSNQLYNYIISHNEMYGMKVFRMNSIIPTDEEMANEYVLVELTSHRVPYKDTNDLRQVDNFDVGVLITEDVVTNSSSNKNTLSLKFFVLLTSQRELFPKLFSSHFGATAKGSFKPIRLYSSQPSSSTHSRKSSTITEPTSDGSLTDSSLQSIRETLSSSGGIQERNTLAVKALPLLSTSATAAGICDEEITYLGYFSNHETVMLQMLQSKAKETETQLAVTVTKAAIDCRRDYLWSCLLPRRSDFEPINMNINEFNELLNLVTTIRLDKYDYYLSAFIGHHITWYHGLAKILINKFGISHRNFSSSDGKNVKYVFSHNLCLDSFILITISEESAHAELSLALKNSSIKMDTRESFSEVCSNQCHALIEDFVNGCAYFMWTTIP